MKHLLKKIKSFSKLYLKTFRTIPKEVLMIDFLSFGSIIGFLLLIKFLISHLFNLLLPMGFSQEEFQSFIINNSLEEVKMAVTKVQFFSVFLLIFLVIGFFLLIYIYFISRKKIMNHLFGFSQKKLFLKFILFLLISFLIIFIMFLIYTLIVFLIVFLVSILTNNNPNYTSMARSFTLFVGVVSFLLFFYELKYNFFKSNLIWSSIGVSFSNFWKFFRRIFKLICIAVITLMITNYIVLSIIEKIFNKNSIVFIMFQLIIFILFISWSRNYFYQTVKSDHKHHKS